MEQGSLSRAARGLGLTQPTMGRHIDSLEAALGLTLFVRGQQGLTPTEHALDILPHARAMAAAAAALTRSATGQSEAIDGTVRIAASDEIGCEVLPPILARFREQHPAVAIELVTSNRMSNLLTREADIAVRMAPPVQGALVARRIGIVKAGLYAHEDYVRRHGLPATLDDRQAHTTIGFDADANAIRNMQAAGITLQRDLFDFRCDNPAAQLAALRAGIGIGGVLHGIAARYDDLVPVLRETVSFSLEMWLAMHRDLRSVRRVRVMFHHLAESLAQWLALAQPDEQNPTPPRAR